ncbi:siroheme synthase CysG [Pseudoteredinibacter isoporae]|uniref:Siroheme synthase n=1 Tax=Pseudoteredinibacter isoporae TaxID=570281 RepID=A0A7X0JSS9_9GAMM|nr:siroheme synthase CysG [Pseudoteredinibacter isoporae]MBB6521592.1 uroporphyrin-III C-methyltransferase/precorrin-2 dehydrogenase/sirohydrochlorin ferrochelatase [Pseudoteredinibacter isoporae]NHO87146.1 uroporphyrinogen-III C-methyltransferase [Pseudoteredinibacter isoporae]NIB22970.1 uroporphyrinogen-III C-methyltransferase [Pseudoteredinibacter isoporae]
MDYFPLFHDLRGRHCLVVGGGAVAARKLRLLLKTPVRVVLFSPDLHRETRELVDENSNRVSWTAQRFDLDKDSAQLDQQAFVIAATDDAGFNKALAALCKQKNVAINVVDQPELCTIITPAIVDRSPIVIAISTAGKAPVLGRRIRRQLEENLPANLGRFAELLGDFRKKISKKITDEKQRLRFWQWLVDGPAQEAALKNQLDESRDIIDRALEHSDKELSSEGEVYLVGAGPGDPELLTLKALRLMQQADVVLYDRLVSPAIMDLLRRDADRIYVGKRRSDHAVPQEDINQLLVKLAKEGKRVLRLKGGDPFIFGRGGEELETLAESGVSFQVVPGITAASGCASYAGIPLTHRDYAQSVRFITGHLQNNQENIRWAELAAADQTLVFYMSLVGLPTICKALIDAGRDKHTPAALVEKGSCPEQRVLISDLNKLPQEAAQHQFRAPTLLIIGGVVALHKQLHWFQGQDRLISG